MPVDRTGFEPQADAGFQSPAVIGGDSYPPAEPGRPAKNDIFQFIGITVQARIQRTVIKIPHVMIIDLFPPELACKE